MELLHFTCLKWEKHLPTHWAIFPVLVVSQWDPIFSVAPQKKTMWGTDFFKLGHISCVSFVLVHKCWVWRSSRKKNTSLLRFLGKSSSLICVYPSGFISVCLSSLVMWVFSATGQTTPKSFGQKCAPKTWGCSSPLSLQTRQPSGTNKRINQLIHLDITGLFNGDPPLWQIKWSFSQLLLASNSLFWGGFFLDKRGEMPYRN